jgi:hypothetical protein
MMSLIRSHMAVWARTSDPHLMYKLSTQLPEACRPISFLRCKSSRYETYTIVLKSITHIGRRNYLNRSCRIDFSLGCTQLQSRALSSDGNHNNYTTSKRMHPKPDQSKSYKETKRPNYERWEVRDCQSVDALLQTTIDKFNVSPPSTIAAVWSYFPTLLRNNHSNTAQQEDVSEKEHKIAYLIHQTLRKLDVFRPKELATIISSLAKILQAVQHQASYKQKSASHQAFGNILLDDNSNPNPQIFDPLAQESQSTIHKFDARCLSNLAHAHASLLYNPKLQNGYLFDSVAQAALPQISHYNSQGVANTLWSFAKLGVCHSQLFQQMGDFVIFSGLLDSFKPRELSITLWSFATVKEEHKVLFQKAGDAVFTTIDLNEFQPQELSNIVWAYANMGLVHPKLFDAIGDHISTLSNLNSFAPQALSITVRSFASSGHCHPALFRKVAQEIVMKRGDLHSFASQALANTVWAYATLNEPYTELFERVAHAIIDQGRLKKLNPQEMSITIWSFATAGMEHNTLFQMVGDEIASRGDLREFGPQNLANIVWAFATATVIHRDMFQTIGDSIVKSDGTMRSFKPLELANTLWAYATLDIHHAELFNRVGNFIVDQGSLEQFEPSHISIIAWSFAKASQSHPKLFASIATAISQRDNLNSFKPQELVNVIWTYASMAEANADVFKSIGDEILSRDLSSFTAQNLSNAVWAYATAQIDHPDIFHKVASAIIESDRLQSFTSQAISNTLWAYAKAQVYQPGLYKIVGDMLMETDNLNSFSPQELSNLLKAFAAANELRPAIFVKFADTIVGGKKLESFTPHGISTIGWCFAVADVDVPSLFNERFIEVIAQNELTFPKEGLAQLHQWHLWQAKEQTGIGLPNELKIRCQQVFTEGEVTISSFQSDVLKELLCIGLNPIEEYLTDSGYRLDALVEINNDKVGIEVDGPNHFIGRKPSGSTVLKRRQVSSLEKMVLVSVPYFDWYEFGCDRDKKQQYLCSLLRLDAGSL